MSKSDDSPHLPRNQSTPKITTMFKVYYTPATQSAHRHKAAPISCTSQPNTLHSRSSWNGHCFMDISLKHLYTLCVLVGRFLPTVLLTLRRQRWWAVTVRHMVMPGVPNFQDKCSSQFWRGGTQRSLGILFEAMTEVRHHRQGPAAIRHEPPIQKKLITRWFSKIIWRVSRLRAK